MSTVHLPKHSLMLPVSIDIVDNLAKDPDIFLGNQWKPKQSPN